MFGKLRLEETAIGFNLISPYQPKGVIKVAKTTNNSSHNPAPTIIVTPL